MGAVSPVWLTLVGWFVAPLLSLAGVMLGLRSAGKRERVGRAIDRKLDAYTALRVADDRLRGLAARGDEAWDETAIDMPDYPLRQFTEAAETVELLAPARVIDEIRNLRVAYGECFRSDREGEERFKQGLPKRLEAITDASRQVLAAMRADVRLHEWAP